MNTKKQASPAKRHQRSPFDDKENTMSPMKKNQNPEVKAEKVDEPSNSDYVLHQKSDEIDKAALEKWLNETEKKNGKNSQTYKWLLEKLKNEDTSRLTMPTTNDASLNQFSRTSKNKTNEMQEDALKVPNDLTRGRGGDAFSRKKSS